MLHLRSFFSIKIFRLLPLKLYEKSFLKLLKFFFGIFILFKLIVKKYGGFVGVARAPCNAGRRPPMPHDCFTYDIIYYYCYYSLLLLFIIFHYSFLLLLIIFTIYYYYCLLFLFIIIIFFYYTFSLFLLKLLLLIIIVIIYYLFAFVVQCSLLFIHILNKFLNKRYCTKLILNKNRT